MYACYMDSHMHVPDPHQGMPALSTHDTLILLYPAAYTDPAATPLERQPQDYVQRVRATHEHGGYGSSGSVCSPPF